MKKLLTVVTALSFYFFSMAQGDPAVSSTGFASGSIAVNQTTVLNIDVTNSDFVNFLTIPSGGYQVSISLPASLVYRAEPLNASALVHVSGPLFDNITYDGVNVFTADLAAPQGVGVISKLQLTVKGLIITATPVVSVVEVAPLTAGVAATDLAPNNSLQPSLLITTPLALKLLDFNATIKDCNSELTWRSANEENFDRFEIEYSTDGGTYQNVGTVKGQNTGASGNYKFNYPQQTIKGFYRLKMVDKNGNINYSNVVKLTNICKEVKAFVYPNPVAAMQDANVVLQNFGNKVEGILYDAAGKQLRVVKLANGSNKLNLQQYTGGNYLLNIKDENNTAVSVRITVAR
ncbi:MAG: T9SS type A sorting domain-containing protein [Chitinophagaceae bacterium]|nr:T9SS type A sorting domain-containing protein [Chitinophagaceae bacterium]